MKEDILGIDVGKVRVGVAKASSKNKIAFPVGVYSRAKYEAEGKILDIIKKNNIITLVVGLPLSENGEESIQCQDVRKFTKRLSNRTDIRIMYQDEYASSLEAKERLLALNKLNNSKEVDAHAACLILESYFNSNE